MDETVSMKLPSRQITAEKCRCSLVNICILLQTAERLLLKEIIPGRNKLWLSTTTCRQCMPIVSSVSLDSAFPKTWKNFRPGKKSIAQAMMHQVLQYLKRCAARSAA